MVKLTKAIIKKHGITKKAWRVARQGTKKKSKSSSKPKAKAKIRRTNKVANKKSESKGFKLPSGVGAIIGPLIYGWSRERLSLALSQTRLVQRLPITDFTDEGVMLAVNWGARKMGAGKIPILNNVLRAQKSIEWARIGQSASDLQTKKSTGQAGSIFLN